MAISQFQPLEAEKQQSINLLQVTLRLAATGRGALAKKVSDCFSMKEIAPDGTIMVTKSELAALSNRIGQVNFAQHVAPRLKEVPVAAEPQKLARKSGFY
ncbi:Uncharacterised protein [uncultured archaeon]|nr:Uncharacterised protein [uncultured archaeon]